MATASRSKAKKPPRGMALRLYGVLLTDEWGDQRLSPVSVFTTYREAVSRSAVLRGIYKRTKVVRLTATMVSK